MHVIRSAEIITVGTELLLGEIVDTNSSLVASDLARLGVDVYWSQRVGDNRRRLEAAIAAALSRSELVVLMGGLGPTEDDLTRDALAAVVGEEQHVDPEIEAWLLDYFRGRGSDMPPANVQQAHVIPSATVLPNPIGTAPGWLVVKEVDGAERVAVTLPGPPRELARMWEQEAKPRLALPTSRLFVKTFKTLGLGESAVAQMLGPLTSQANPSVATYAKFDGVHVRVAAKGASAEQAEELAAPTVGQVESLLHEQVWGTDGDELAELVLARLAERGQRLAVAEGLSGGLLTSWLTAAARPGATPASAASGRPAGERAQDGVTSGLAGSVVAYDPELMRTLGIPSTLLDSAPLAAAEVVAALAAAIRVFFAADFGIAIGPADPVFAKADPVSGPGASRPVEDQRLPTNVVIAVARDATTTIKTLELPPLGRAWQRERTAVSSLNLLRLSLR